jgi:MFS family permease
MAFWIKEISWKKIFLVSFLFTIISFVIRQIEAMLTMNYYKMPEFFGVWSRLMMPKAGPPPASFMITSLVFTFATGISLALIYYYLKDHLPKENKKRIFYFADLMIGTSFVFFTLPVYLMFNIPGGLLISWFISSFIILTINSWMLVKIIK